MVTAEMAVSLITATMAVIAGVWAVSLVIVHDACRVTASQMLNNVPEEISNLLSRHSGRLQKVPGSPPLPGTGGYV